MGRYRAQRWELMRGRPVGLEDKAGAVARVDDAQVLGQAGQAGGGSLPLARSQGRNCTG